MLPILKDGEAVRLPATKKTGFSVPLSKRPLGAAALALGTIFWASAAAAQTAPAAPAGAAPKEMIVPLVDHHQHLISQLQADLINPKVHAAIILPPPLASLLQKRNAAWNSREGLLSLYTDDALALMGFGMHPGWIRGAPAIATYFSGRFGKGGDYQLLPVGYQEQGSLASITGYFTRGEGVSLKRQGWFHMAARRLSDGNWRIAAESITMGNSGPPVAVLGAAGLVSLLDEAGIRRAVILSGGFVFSGRGFDVYRDTESAAARHEKVRAENDWTAQQVALFPDRLVAFCSFNPLDDFAVTELERCMASRKFAGVKLHLDESSVDYQKADHVEKVRRVFAAANRLRAAIIVHFRNNRSTTQAEDVGIFLDRIVSAAPDVPVQIAHLWGGGGFSGVTLNALADAVSARHPATKNLYFDMAEAPLIAQQSGSSKQAILDATAKAMRQIGLDRILYGSDGGIRMKAKDAWEQFRSSVPLTEDEFRIIANNVAPYMR